MRLIFYISLRKDLEALKKFREIEEAFSGNPYYFFRVFKNLKNKSEKEMVRFFQENKEEIKRKLLERKERIESLWEPIDSKFFREVERITGFPWKFEYYKAHISSVLPGCYEKYRNKISVFCFLEECYLCNSRRIDPFALLGYFKGNRNFRKKE